MTKKWLVKPLPSQDLKQRFPELDDIVLQMLCDRGLTTQAQIDEFLNPEYCIHIHDPFLFKAMDACVARIFKAIKNQELIYVYGDYDADGVSGAVILSTILQGLGAKYQIYLPHRDQEGYGLNIKAVDYIHEQGTKLIITVDCGISNIKEIDHAVSKGIDVIVTDHHQQQAVLPNAICVHPKLTGENYPYKGLAGGGVAFKVAQALVKTKLKQEPNEDPKHWEGFEKWLLDMVAISTVADMMPLTGENRTLVKYGLIVMNKGRRLGLKHLLKVSNLWPELAKEVKLNAFNIGFQIAPRINAAGRVNHANVAYRLLMAATEEDASKLAAELNQNNRERQQITERIIKEALEQIGEVDETQLKVLSAFKQDWPIGVAGLVASKLVEKYNRPAIIMGLLGDKIVGSVRSIPAFNFVNALIELKDLFAKFGGHPMAAGFTLARNEDLPMLVEKLNQIIDRELKGKDLTPELIIDREIPLSSTDWKLYENIIRLEPFGKENPIPRFLTNNLHIITIDRVGAEAKHLRLTLQDDDGLIRKCIGFGLGVKAEAEQIKQGDKIDLVYELDVNEWNGNRELQLKVVDFKKIQT